MNFAVLQQYDSPHNIYNRPKNLFVANFIGSPTINFFDGSYKGGTFSLSDFSNGKLTVSKENKKMVDEKVKGEDVVLGIRPEHLKLGGDKDKNSTNLQAKVVSFEPLGSKTIVYLYPNGNPGLILKSSMDSDYKPRIGDVKNLVFEEKNLYLFDKSSTNLIFRFGS